VSKMHFLPNELNPIKIVKRKQISGCCKDWHLLQVSTKTGTPQTGISKLRSSESRAHHS
ncbi:unnamed protein product, partial [Coccothraustes coccothraustes]